MFGNTNSFATVTNVWFFTALVYTNTGGGTIQVYIGTTNAAATLAATLTGIGVLSSTNTWKNTTNLFLIGNRATDGKRNFPGTIDDVRLYRQALSLAQLQKVQNVFTPPLITQQPTPDGVFPGVNPQFSVAASGSLPLAYQWQLNGTNLTDRGNISGSATSVLTISNVSTADVFNNYQVVITNQVGSVTSTQVSLSLISTNGTYEGVALTNNPFAYYSFSETGDPELGNVQLNDSMGVYNGTYGMGGVNDQAGSGALNGADGIAGPQAAADGLIGFPDTNTALGTTYQDFPVDSYVTAPPFNLNNGAGTNVLTITAWIKPAGSQVHAAGIVFSRSGTTVAGLDYNATNSVDGNLTLGYTWNNDVNTYTWNSALEPTPGIWSLVALVITPTNASIYVINQNGLLFSTHNYTNVFQRFEGPTLIGNDINDTTGKRNFNGTIDEVAFFNQALTASQMSSLYAAASGVVFAPQPPTISTEPAWPSPIYPGQSASATVISAGGQTFQWEAGLNGIYTNLTDGTNLTGSATPTLTINSVQPANALDYIIVISNSFGAITSTPPATLTLTPAGPAENFTLNLGGAPIVEGSGSDWNTVNNWNPNGQPANVSAYSNPGSTYEVVAGARLRTPLTAALQVFPGVELTLDGSGVFENDPNNPTNVSELRFKNGAVAPTNYFSTLVLNGGQLDSGIGAVQDIQGTIDVTTNSAIYVDSGAGVDRGYQIDSYLTGPGTLLWHEWSGALGGTGLQITCATNTFSGAWIVDQGALVGVGANSLGTNTVIVGTNGLTAALETVYNINSPNASLILGTNGLVFLHQNDHFGSVIINGSPLANGTYPFATLNSLYPTNFPSTWPQQPGSTFTTGSGQIIVGTGGPAPSPHITGIALHGATLSISATNGTAGGSWILLQSTNLALPLSLWQTNATGNFDGSGNLSASLANNATNTQEFYILQTH